MNSNEMNAFKPINDNPIILDFSACKYLGEVHKVLKKSFGFPEYYGENWDALWDCLRYLFDDNRLIKIYGLAKLPNELDEEIAILLNIFDRVHKETPNVSFEIVP